MTAISLKRSSERNRATTANGRQPQFAVRVESSPWQYGDRRRSAFRQVPGRAGHGQLPPFDATGKLLLERPLYFGSGRKANSHNSAVTVDRLIRKLAFADDRLPLGDLPLRTRCGLSDCSIAAAQDRPENRRPVRGAPVGQVIGVAFRILALRATARGLRTAPRSVATEPPHR